VHRRVAGRWLARLHVGAAERVLTGLPNRGLEQFLMALRTGASATEWVADHPDLSTDERTGLRRARRALDVTEARWPEIQALAAPLPVTLVHGDLVRKNVRVAGAPGESTLLAFDWERSGRGTAALDLAQLEGSRRFSANPCLDAYRAELRNNGLDIPLEDVRRAAMVGTILRCLDGVEWAASGLSPRWVHNPTADLTVYGLWLDRALQTIGLLRSGLDAS
jgi:Ser/Thr protein kinase RdoA (MazF antagonist)